MGTDGLEPELEAGQGNRRSDRCEDAGVLEGGVK